MPWLPAAGTSPLRAVRKAACRQTQLSSSGTLQLTVLLPHVCHDVGGCFATAKTPAPAGAQSRSKRQIELGMEYLGVWRAVCPAKQADSGSSCDLCALALQEGAHLACAVIRRHSTLSPSTRYISDPDLHACDSVPGP